jgi:hypothetical protein
VPARGDHCAWAVDEKLKHKQVVWGREIAVAVLIGKRDKLDFLRPLVSELERTLLEIKAGQLREVGV